MCIASNDVDGAMKYYEQRLPITRRIGDRLAEGTVIGNIGIVHFLRGDPARAIEFYDRHIAIAQQIGDLQGEAKSFLNKSASLGKLGRSLEAIEAAQRAVKIFQRIGSPLAADAEIILENLQRTNPSREQ